MAQYFLKLPKMGESVAEATITKWLKEIGDSISLDDPIVEIATDKVDTDVCAEVSGILLEKRFEENTVVAVGDVLAVIETDGVLVEHSSNTSPELLEVKAPDIEDDIKEEESLPPLLEGYTGVLLDKIKTVKTGFGSEKSMLQKKLQAARGHLSNAREKAMSDKERIMSETHKKDIIELEKKHVLALAEKDLEIQKVEKHVARQMQRIKVLEMAIRNAKVEMVKEKLHDMDEEYDYLSRVGVPPMGIFEKGEVGY